MGSNDKIWDTIARNIAVALCFSVVGQVGVVLNAPGTLGSPFWPASGIALVAMILWGRSALPGIALGAVIIDLINFAPLPFLSLLFDAFGTCAEPVIALAIMRRLSADEPLSMQSTSGTLASWLGMATGSIAATTLGLAGFAIGSALPETGIMMSALTWWIGNVSGALVTAPFFMAWIRNPKPARPRKHPIEALALLGALPAMAGFIYAGDVGSANIVEIMAVPAILAAVYRFGLHGMVTAATVAAITTLIIGLSIIKNGGEQQNVVLALLRLQIFITIIAGTGQLLVSQIIIRARTEEQLRQALDRAEDANKAKTMFLAKMSHELRTPLNAILGFSEMIAQQVDRRPEDLLIQHREFAKDIQFSGHHLLLLINDILDIAKIESGSLDLKDTDIDIAAITTECLTMVQARADARKLILATDIPDDLPRLRADIRAIRQVLLNLLSNAIKYTQGGTISIACRHGKDGLRLSVSDTGPGIPADVMESLFEPFRRGQPHRARSSETEGTGLGLAICKGLVDHHQGRIEVDSQAGHGTFIHVTFPPERVA